MKKFFTLVVVMISVLVANSQVVVLDEAVSDTVKEKLFGPNQRHYVHTYYSFGTGFSLEEETGAKQFGSTFRFEIGLRYKYKISEYFALGGDLNFSTDMYNFDMEQPASAGYKSEYYSLNSWGLSVFTRFNIGKRGNTLGTYVDLLGYGQWNPGRYYTYFKEEDSTDPMLSHSATKQVVYNRLDFLSKTSAGAGLRVGHKGISIVAMYRLTDLLLTDMQPALMPHGELPALNLGLEIGF